MVHLFDLLVFSLVAWKLLDLFDVAVRSLASRKRRTLKNGYSIAGKVWGK